MKPRIWQQLAEATRTIKLHRSERTENRRPDGSLLSVSWHSVPAGTRTGTVMLEVDIDGLLEQLAERALRAKGRQAQACGGSIRVRVLQATNSPEPAAP